MNEYFRMLSKLHFFNVKSISCRLVICKSDKNIFIHIFSQIMYKLNLKERCIHINPQLKRQSLYIEYQCN
jgi:hypothetical protein